MFVTYCFKGAEMIWMVAFALVGSFLFIFGISMFFAKAPQGDGDYSVTAQDYAKESMRKVGGMFVLAGAVLLVGCVTWFYAIRQPAPNECGDRIMAYVMSQKAVKTRLRSPGSAKFPSLSEASSERIGECVFQVTGFVDSQNGFGATIRTHYSTEMHHQQEGNTWSARRLVLE